MKTQRITQIAAARAPRRAGAITLEFLLSFPILFIATLALFEFGILILVQHAATAAVIQGANEGAKVGHGDDNNDDDYMDDLADDIVDVVNQPLALYGVGFTATPTQVWLRVERNPGDTAPGTVQTFVDRGENALAFMPFGPALAPGELRVSLAVRLTDTAGQNPVPNWLSSFGFNLTNRDFRLSARAVLENNDFNP